jgi:hypothetical protein
MEKYGFVYRWYDKKHDRYYIGAHWGTEDDGYICSSVWMKKAYEIRLQDFSRKILERIYTNKKDTFIAEDKYLREIKPEELGTKYYNLKNYVAAFWTIKQQRLTKQKLKGKPCSEQTKQKLRVANLGKKQSKETKEKKSKALKGRIFSEDHRRKLSEAAVKGQKGRVTSEETKQKLSMVHKGRKNTAVHNKNIIKNHWSKSNTANEISNRISETLRKRNVVHENR